MSRPTAGWRTCSSSPPSSSATPPTRSPSRSRVAKLRSGRAEIAVIPRTMAPSGLGGWRPLRRRTQRERDQFRAFSNTGDESPAVLLQKHELLPIRGSMLGDTISDEVERLALALAGGH